MKFTTGFCLGTLLHCCIVIETVKSIELKERHYKRHRVVRWTDRFGPSMEDPKEQMTIQDTVSPRPSTSENFKPIVPQDKHKDKNEVTLDGNNTVASRPAHPPLPSPETTILYDTIPSHEFCNGQIPESRICDPDDIINLTEGMVIFLAEET